MKIIIQKRAKFLFSIMALILVLGQINVQSNEHKNATFKERDSLQTVRFPVRASTIDPDYDFNKNALLVIKEYFDTLDLSNIDSVIIVGSTSVEGSPDFNVTTAKKRANSLKDFIVAQGRVPIDMIHAVITTDTWDQTIDLIRKDPNFPNKEQIMIVIDQAPVESRLWLIQKLDYTAEYNYIFDFVFPLLRNVRAIVIRSSANKDHNEDHAKDQTVQDNPYQEFIAVPSDVQAVPSITQPSQLMINDTLANLWAKGHKALKAQKPLFALKTNLLYDAATILNASLEVPIGKHWSIAAEFIFPWWVDQKRQNALQIYNGNLEVKYWFAPRENQRLGKFSTMTGWFIGIYGGAALYDVEYEGKGYQGESLFSVGLMGGYAHSIGKNLRMEYSLGVGYMQTHYRGYEAKFSPIDQQWNLVRQNSGVATWIGPTQVKISLVWMLNRNVKKGGVR